MLTDSTAPQSPDSPAADAMDKDGFEHRIVPASAAAPLPSLGVRSAFDVAKPMPMLRSPKTRAVMALLLGSHKTVAEVASALRLSNKQAANMLDRMYARGTLMKTGDSSHRTYTVANAQALPAALHKQVHQTTTEPAPPTLDEPTLRCGLFNDGALHLEAQGQTPLRLNKAQTRVLVDYLDKISTALSSEPL